MFDNTSPIVSQMHDKLNKRVRAHFVFLRHFFTITSVDERLELNVIYQTMQGQEKTFQKKNCGCQIGRFHAKDAIPQNHCTIDVTQWNMKKNIARFMMRA
jgi:hypothetical protein